MSSQSSNHNKPFYIFALHTLSFMIRKTSLIIDFCKVAILGVSLWLPNTFTRLNLKFAGTFLFNSCCVWFFATPWTAARQASLSSTISRSLFTLMSIELVMPSNHLILSCPFSCPQSYPASGSFPVSRFFASGGQSIGASASVSVLPMNIQDWSPLGWTGWIFLQSKRFSRVFSSTTVRKHQFFRTQPSLRSSSAHLYMTTGKTIALTVLFVGTLIMFKPKLLLFSGSI